MTTTDNKLIADFMNSKVSENTYFINGMYKEVNNLKYDNDWNCLMEVVEKIESFEDENRCAKYNFIIEQSFVEIVYNNNSDTIVNIDRETKIKAVHDACIEFIKWYNKQ